MTPDWSNVRRVLCIRLDSMGDVLMTTPALRAVRENVDHVTLLTSPAGAAAARLVEHVDEVIVHEAPWMKAGDAHSSQVELTLIERLRARRFDAVVIFTVFSQTPFPAAMLGYLAAIPLALAHCRERAYKLVSNAVPETEPEGGIRHEVQRHLDLVATVGWRVSDTRMHVRIADETRASIARLVPQAKRWAVVHPGASAPSRRYPPEMYREALLALATEGWSFLMTGDASEAALIASMNLPFANLAGQLDLERLAALIAAAPLVIANNTGPAHLAAAVGTPVVDLYALTNPQHTPWRVASRVLNHDVDCRWCFSSVCRTGHHLCLRGVPSAAVVAAANALVPA